LEHFEELAEKKENLRKIVNIIHQTEFTLKSNADFLSISQQAASRVDPSLVTDSTNILDQFTSSNFGSDKRAFFDSLKPLQKAKTDARASSISDQGKQ
jgi:hypothetical protein